MPKPRRIFYRNLFTLKGKKRATHAHGRSVQRVRLRGSSQCHWVVPCRLGDRACRGRDRARALLQAHDLCADVLRVREHSCGRDALHMMCKVRARADEAEAVLSAVTRPLGLGEACIAAEASKRLWSNAAKALHQPHDDLVAFANDCVAVIKFCIETCLH